MDKIFMVKLLATLCFHYELEIFAGEKFRSRAPTREINENFQLQKL